MAKKRLLKEKWKLFLDSFRLKSNFLYIILYDLLFYVITIPLFILFPFMLNKKLAGMDPDILYKMGSVMNVTAAQTQELEMAVQSMQSFFAFFVFGMIFLAIASLLAFTLSRTLIWNYLLKQKFDLKHYLRFNVVNIIIAVFLFIVYLIISKLRIAVLTPLVNISLIFAFVVSSLLFLMLFSAITYFVNLVYINYTKKSEIIGSFSAAFKLIKSRISDIFPSYLFIVAVSIIISFIAQLFWLIPFAVQRYLNFAVFILFAAWVRIYILGAIKR
jgi:hypothetical protein